MDLITAIFGMLLGRDEVYYFNKGYDRAAGMFLRDTGNPLGLRSAIVSCKNGANAYDSGAMKACDDWEALYGSRVA